MHSITMKRWERKLNDETKGPVPLNTILQDWFQSSSIDGVGHAGRARNRCTRVLWVIVLLVGLALTIYHIYYILHEYYHRPIRTTVALSSEKKVKKKMYSDTAYLDLLLRLLNFENCFLPLMSARSVLLTLFPSFNTVWKTSR